MSASENYKARFFRKTDTSVSHFMVNLPETWWSRPYEYYWASTFAEKDDIALDAACGISHPFKFFLAENCKEVYACDTDNRILSEELIIQDMKNDFGEKNFNEFSENHLESIKNIKYSQASIIDTGYPAGKFDKIYCISVLEHLPFVDICLSIKEFKWLLKDNGKIILTFDYPLINLEHLNTIIHKAGLKFYYEANFNLPLDAIYIDSYKLFCFRAVLIKR